mmetsp:Transcript_23411/g.57578  ORF Transcript_23411/g.57578 Transcript_23411/m.57578 type:complete len:424 (+) Transcript_23411:251-1522(+)|eukprot:CAMPEP_0113604936 /NCGR_PEP_ID=MMETSP0017_2-20120614/2057_1 /TAXON_ID=2856 /ORGANISM="Cylindrotheca closterium" /LENGTH=423 /DNA_ID=CAMNT_0000513387 /DNA_START=119 /DNA_END=1390 /DNA_ORIENTATION=+ /assembly_acc=CAM_ASM_000147
MADSADKQNATPQEEGHRTVETLQIGQGPHDEESKKVEKKVVPPDMPIEWTKMGETGDAEALPIRYPEDVAEISPDELDICIVGTAGMKITVMSNDFYKNCNENLESLVLRSHLITNMKGLEGFKKLDLLELYDNQLQDLSGLEVPGPNLRVLDMSYNAIRDMSPVAICVNLKELYLANNKLKEIKGLKNLKQLKKLDLGANRIRVMAEEELSGLENLEELWIGKNKIEKIEGLEKLTKLRRLDVQSNRLTQVEGLTAQKDTLEELYLAHNGIDDEGASLPTGLGLGFTQLNVVDVGRNRLTSTAPFAHLESIEEIWLSGNNISTWEAIEPFKKSCEEGKQKMDTLYLEYNPIASEFEYRKRLAEWIPSLNQIDATLIGGLAAHGVPAAPKPSSDPVIPLAEEMRQLQTQVFERAQTGEKSNE